MNLRGQIVAYAARQQIVNIPMPESSGHEVCTQVQWDGYVQHAQALPTLWSLISGMSRDSWWPSVGVACTRAPVSYLLRSAFKAHSPELRLIAAAILKDRHDQGISA